MQPRHALTTENLKIAKKKWRDQLNHSSIRALELLTQAYRLSISSGDLILLDKSWYVTHTGLLGLARRNRCVGIHVEPVPEFSQPLVARWAFKATVFKSPFAKDSLATAMPIRPMFLPLVRGAEMRVAETRAVNRALRKAYGIGICSVEEIGTVPNPS